MQDAAQFFAGSTSLIRSLTFRPTAIPAFKHPLAACAGSVATRMGTRMVRHLHKSAFDSCSSMFDSNMSKQHEFLRSNICMPSVYNLKSPDEKLIKKWSCGPTFWLQYKFERQLNDTQAFQSATHGSLLSKVFVNYLCKDSRFFLKCDRTTMKPFTDK